MWLYYEQEDTDRMLNVEEEN